MPLSRSLPRLVALVAAVVSVAAALPACRSSSPRTAADAAPTSEPVSADALIGNPAFSRAALSPDGRRIAGIASQRGREVVFYYDLRRRKIEPLKEIEEGTSVHTLGWSGDGILVVGFERPRRFARNVARGVEDEPPANQMVAINVDGWRPRDLGPSWEYRGHPFRPSGVMHWLPDDPEYVLLNWWSSPDEGASARRIRVRDGLSSSRVEPMEGVDLWHADARGEVRAGTGRAEDGIARTIHARVGESDPFEEVVLDDLEKQSELEFAGFSPDPATIFVRAIADTGRKGLYEYDLERRRLGALRFAHPRVDVGELVQSPLDGALWAVEIEPDRPALHFFDAGAQRQQASIDAALPGTVNRVVSTDREGEHAVIAVSSDTTPPDYYLYDRARKQMDFLFTAVPGVDRARLAPMRAVAYRARDGLEIPAYLTLPRGRPETKLPVIVIAHDGPSDRAHWGWDPIVQYLASRGFAVFQPNFRGSTGYGREHERAGYRQWGRAMQDDLADGVRWLAAEGIADPRRVGIYGIGYGGYAALMAPVNAPDLFAAVASFGGVTDLVELAENDSQYRSDDPNSPVERSLPSARAQLAATSPVQQAGRIGVPVLIGHGSDDPIVSVAQAEAMEAALEAAGATVDTHYYRGEGHALRDERNRIEFHQKLAAFFERHLGAQGVEPL